MSPANRTPREVLPLWKATVPEFVTALAWSPLGDRLAIGAADGTLALADKNGKPVGEVEAHPLGLLTLAWSHDGTHLATGGQDKKLRVWKASPLEALSACEAGGNSVERVAWCPTAPFIASASGRFLRIWKPTGEMLEEFRTVRHSITAIEWSRDGGMVALGSFEGVRLHRPGVAEAVAKSSQEAPMVSLAWNPRGDFLVGGTQENALLIWNIPKNDDLQAGPYDFKVRQLSWDAEGRYLATGGSTDVSVWDFSVRDMAGARPSFLAIHREPVAALAFQKAGPLLASCGMDGMLAFWNPRLSDHPVALGGGPGPCSAIAWHPNGSHVAVGFEDGSVAVWPAPR